MTTQDRAAELAREYRKIYSQVYKEMIPHIIHGTIVDPRELNELHKKIEAEAFRRLLTLHTELIGKENEIDNVKMFDKICEIISEPAPFGTNVKIMVDGKKAIALLELFKSALARPEAPRVPEDVVSALRECVEVYEKDGVAAAPDSAIGKIKSWLISVNF